MYTDKVEKSPKERKAVQTASNKQAHQATYESFHFSSLKPLKKHYNSKNLKINAIIILELDQIG